MKSTGELFTDAEAGRHFAIPAPVVVSDAIDRAISAPLVV
jgi:hypothetical protein